MIDEDIWNDIAAEREAFLRQREEENEDITAMRRARLLACARKEVSRLEAAKRAGWDVEEDLIKAYTQIKAFS